MGRENNCSILLGELSGKRDDQLVELGIFLGLETSWDVLLMLQPERDLPQKIREKFLNMLLNKTKYLWRQANPELARQLDVDLYVDGEPSSEKYRENQIRWLAEECGNFLEKKKEK